MLTTPTERIVVTQITHLTTQLLAHDDATHQYTTQLDKIRFAPQLPDYYLHRKRSLIAETTPKKNYGYQAIIS